MRSPSRDWRTQPVPSMQAWAEGSASTEKTACGEASIVVDAVARSTSEAGLEDAEPVAAASVRYSLMGALPHCGWRVIRGPCTPCCPTQTSSREAPWS
jgi:hypothetical protein